jgi:hypothetical protein
MYGMPTPNTYGQYGFGAYGANPAASAPGMPQPAAAGAAGGDAAGANAQNQWANVDPSYYQQYWSTSFAVTRVRSFDLRISPYRQLLRPSSCIRSTTHGHAAGRLIFLLFRMYALQRLLSAAYY